MEPVLPSSRLLVILGGGYTARTLYGMKRGSKTRIIVTSRTPEHHLLYADSQDRLHFDIQQTGTWTAIPAEADVLWCFPAEPLEQVAAFARTAGLSSRRLVVLGSTSAYDLETHDAYPPPWIDEGAPLDLTRPRVQGEEWLRAQCNAIVLRVAGIYGPGRNPLEWIRQRRVTASRKYVNLIHVEDLATICLAALELGRAGAVYNVSDGTPRTWASICQTASERWDIHSSAPQRELGSGKRVKTSKLRSELQKDLAFPDLYAALEEIEARPPSPD